MFGLDMFELDPLQPGRVEPGRVAKRFGNPGVSSRALLIAVVVALARAREIRRQQGRPDARRQIVVRS